jgi:hypothetical protein
MTIVKDQANFLRSPGRFIARLSTDSRAALIGFRNVLAIAFLYEGAILLWALGADRVTMPSFLRIDEQLYYFYELIFLIPLFIVTWLLASSIAYVLSKALGGRGSFDAMLGGYGLSMAISAYFTLIPDYIQGLLWTTGWVPFDEYQEITGQGALLVIVWSYMLAYTLAHIFLYSITIHKTQSLDGIRSALVGFVSFLGSFAIWITFVR